MKRTAVIAVSIVGLVIAAWHLDIARRALFVFREHEPVTSWLAVVLGPSVTVLGCILAYFRAFAGGVAVTAGAFAGAVAFLIGEGGMTEYVTPYLLQFTAPMAAIGATLILLSRWRVQSRVGNAT